MPDLPDSTAMPTQSTEPPLYLWEEHAAFRSTFLMHFTKEGDRATLEAIGQLLYDMALEVSGNWPRWRESSTRTEIRAVLADLRHAQAFLAAIARSRHVASLGVEDERLSLMADELTSMVGRTTSLIESIIGPL